MPPFPKTRPVRPSFYNRTRRRISRFHNRLNGSQATRHALDDVSAPLEIAPPLVGKILLNANVVRNELMMKARFANGVRERIAEREIFDERQNDTSYDHMRARRADDGDDVAFLIDTNER